jgi:hypothetical protein
MGTGFWGHLSTACRPGNAPRPGDKEASVARRERTGSTTLEVRITFEPSWVSPACVAQAYERVVPITHRLAPRARVPQPADSAPQTQQIGRRQHA